MDSENLLNQLIHMEEKEWFRLMQILTLATMLRFNPSPSEGEKKPPLSRAQAEALRILKGKRRMRAFDLATEVGVSRPVAASYLRILCQKGYASVEKGLYRPLLGGGITSR